MEHKHKDNLNKYASSMCTVPEIAFAVDLIKYVLNEHQIKWQTNKLPFCKNMRRLFHKSMGSNIMYGLLVYKDTWGYISGSVFPSVICSSETLLFLSDYLFGRRSRFFYKLEAFCCFLCYLCVLLAQSNLFRTVDKIANILAYVLIDNRGNFEACGGWESYQRFVNSRHLIFRIPDAA